MSLRATAVVVSPRSLGGRYCPGFCFLDCAEACRQGARKLRGMEGVSQSGNHSRCWQSMPKTESLRLVAC